MSNQGVAPYIPYLKLYALAAVGIQTGMILSMSYPSIPSVLSLRNNSSLLSVWSGIYRRGKNTMPPLAITASVSFFAVAYTLKSTPYAIAGILPPCIVPFTITAMRSSVGRLLEWADAAGVNANNVGAVVTTKGKGKDDEEPMTALDVDEVRAEIDNWGFLNVIRGMFPLSGFVVGLYATVF